MSHEGTLRLALASPDEAARLAAALAPDDDGFVEIRVEGSLLVASARSDAPMGLLRTLDEVLVTVAAAQRAGALVE